MEEDHRIKISPKTVQHEQCGFCGKQADKADERITLYRVVPGKKYITAEVFHPTCRACRFIRRRLATTIALVLIILLGIGMLTTELRTGEGDWFGIVFMSLVVLVGGFYAGAGAIGWFEGIFCDAYGMEEESTHEVVKFMKDSYKWQEQNPEKGHIITKKPIKEEELVNMYEELATKFNYQTERVGL